METRNWRAWRDTSTDGEPCVRVEGLCVTAGPGYGVELQRHGAEQGDAGGGSGELVLDLIVRPPRDDRGGETVEMTANYVFEERAGQVSSVLIRQGGRRIAQLEIEGGAAGAEGGAQLGAGQAARAGSGSSASG
ncbi:MAG TPA: hypothetical protein VFN74_24215 [Chloroflexota bacterium]|nr:hypothetical protein [Chloroflexota bacterium]